jgi:hypothetical protein
MPTTIPTRAPQQRRVAFSDRLSVCSFGVMGGSKNESPGYADRSRERRLPVLARTRNEILQGPGAIRQVL